MQLQIRGQSTSIVECEQNEKIQAIKVEICFFVNIFFIVLKGPQFFILENNSLHNVAL